MFTVVIPVYNKADTLSVSVGSVFAQTETDWELIVVDDGSKDDFAAAIAPYTSDPRVTVIRQQNAGVSVARNRGIEVAKGEYVAFLDADDEWLPHCLAQYRQMMAQEPGAGIYAAPIRILLPGGGVTDTVRYYVNDGIWREPDIFAYAYRIGGGMAVNVISSCYRRDLLLEHGGFQPGERLGEDTDFSLKIAAYCDVVMCNNPAAVYHRERSTATSAMGFLNYNWYFEKREPELLADERIPAQKRYYIRCALDHFRIHKARHYLLEGKRRLAAAEMRKVCRNSTNLSRIVTTWGMMVMPKAVLQRLYEKKREKEPM